MPLYVGADVKVRRNLLLIASGERAPVIEIGALTHAQFTIVNSARTALGLPEIRENAIVFLGRHLFNSRAADGYTIDDMIEQIESSLDENSVVLIQPRMTAMENPNRRADQYGNSVNDRAIFEATARKPRIELFSVIPKGDAVKPINVKLKI